jgi:hypothetical protein
MNDAVDLSLLLNKTEEQKATQLPQPKGYKILVTLPDIDEEFEGVIDKRRNFHRISRIFQNYGV